MKLSDQMVSLEIAKKLKSLGVKQESFFYWKKIGDDFALSNIGKNIWLKPDDIFGECLQLDAGVESFSAFTVSELGEIIKPINRVDDDKNYFTYWNGERWVAWEQEYGLYKNGYEITGKTEAEARGKMLIYLIENKIIEV